MRLRIDGTPSAGHGNELPELKRAYTEKREILYRGAKLQV